MITLRSINRDALINKIRWIKGNITFFTKTIPNKKTANKYRKMLRLYNKELKSGRLK
jgi:hypothetical protein